MDTDRWQRVERVCHEALELDPNQQPAFLDGACGGDAALRHEVESLLAHRSQASAFMETPALEVAAKSLVADDSYRSIEVPRLIGRVLSDYRIVEKVGVGGMGEVFRAVRADGTYEKQVAIKLVQSGLGTDYFLDRFRNERKILANLDHPNIARLIDAGSTEEGLPYVVMEYVEGLPIDAYCEKHALDIPAQLNLFRIVCSAVQCAHKNLVVHRDLKPGNILVTQEGVPKLLDFGIAKILHSEESPEARTVTLFPLLTPDFASPEQVRNEPITTSSDIYSLGVILYVLLTGRHPYKNKRTAPHELLRAICEVEPPKPSIAVVRPQPSETGKATDSAAPSITRETESRNLRRVLAGDLDNIVLKALRKEPERRYASVEQFSEDIRRHLARLPVIAHQDGLRYRAQKFVSRNRLGVGTVALVILSLVGGLIATLREARIARAERERSERRFNDVRALANSLLFDLHDAIQDLPGSTPARKLLVEQALQYLDSLSSDANTDTGLARELATAYERVGELQGQPLSSNVGETSNSLTSHQKALAIRRRLGERPNAEWQDRLSLAESYRRMATELISVGNTQTALSDAQNAASIGESVSNARPNDVHVLYELGADYEVLGNIQGNTWGYAGLRNLTIALEKYNRALAAQTRILSIEPNTLTARRAWTLDALRIGNIQMDLGHAAEALATFHEALDVSLSLSHASGAAQDLRRVAVIYNQLAMLYDRTSERSLCLDNHKKGLEIYKQLVSQDPKNALFRHGVAIAYANVGDSESKLGYFSNGVAHIKRALAIMNTLVEGDPNSEQRDILAQIHVSLGDVFARAVRLREAIREYQIALGIYEAMLSSGNNAGMITGVETCKVRIAEAERRSGNLIAAIADFQKALSLSIPRLDSDDDTRRNTAKAYSGLADIEWKKASEITSRERQRHGEQAIQLYRRSLEVGKQVPPLAPDDLAGFSAPAVARRLRKAESELNRLTRK